MNFGSGGNTKSKAWKDIWGSGQGIGRVSEITSTEKVVDQLEKALKNAINDLKNRTKDL